MSKKRYVDTCFWDDSYIQALDPSEKLMFLYLLTNPLATICGAYEVSIRHMVFHTGFDKDMVERILSRFERDGRCIYRDGWVAMRNWIKHQNTKNPQISRGIELQLAEVPAAIAEYVLGTVEEPPPPQEKPKKVKKEEAPEYTRCLKHYYEKHEDVLGFKPKVNGQVGKLLKEDIARVKELGATFKMDWEDLFGTWVDAFLEDQVNEKMTAFCATATHEYNVFHGCLPQMINHFVQFQKGEG